MMDRLKIGDKIPVIYGLCRVSPLLVDDYVFSELSAAAARSPTWNPPFVANEDWFVVGTIWDTTGFNSLAERAGFVGSNPYYAGIFALGEAGVSKISYLLIDEQRSSVDRRTGQLRFVLNRWGREAFPAYVATNPIADSNFKGEGVSTLMVLAGFNKTLPIWDEAPRDLDVVVEGIKVWDPRVSSQSFTATRRAGYTALHNPALILLDFLTRPYGLDFPIDLIDLESFKSAADHCDQLIDIPARLILASNSRLYDPTTGNVVEVSQNTIDPYYRAWQGSSTTQERYKFGGIVGGELDFKESVERILKSMCGYLIFSEGKYKLVLEKARSSVDMVFNADNIQLGSYAISTKSRSKVYNQITMKFDNRSKEFEEDSVMFPLDNDVEFSTNKAVDGERLHKEFTIKGVYDTYQAAELAILKVRISRQDKQAQFISASLEALLLEPTDIITIKHPLQFGMDENQKFLVEEVSTDTNNWQTTITARIYDASIFDPHSFANELRSRLGDEAGIYDISPITSLSAVVEYSNNPDGTRMPKIKVEWVDSNNKNKGYIVRLEDLGGEIFDELKVFGNKAEFRAMKADIEYVIRVYYQSKVGGLLGEVSTTAFVPGLQADGSLPDVVNSTTITNYALARSMPDGVMRLEVVPRLYIGGSSRTYAWTLIVTFASNMVSFNPQVPHGATLTNIVTARDSDHSDLTGAFNIVRLGREPPEGNSEWYGSDITTDFSRTEEELNSDPEIWKPRVTLIEVTPPPAWNIKNLGLGGSYRAVYGSNPSATDGWSVLSVSSLSSLPQSARRFILSFDVRGVFSANNVSVQSDGTLRIDMESETWYFNGWRDIIYVRIFFYRGNSLHYSSRPYIVKDLTNTNKQFEINNIYLDFAGVTRIVFMAYPASGLGARESDITDSGIRDQLGKLLYPCRAIFSNIRMAHADPM